MTRIYSRSGFTYTQRLAQRGRVGIVWRGCLERTCGGKAQSSTRSVAHRKHPYMSRIKDHMRWYMQPRVGGSLDSPRHRISISLINFVHFDHTSVAHTFQNLEIGPRRSSWPLGDRLRDGLNGRWATIACCAGVSNGSSPLDCGVGKREAMCPPKLMTVDVSV